MTFFNPNVRQQRGPERQRRQDVEVQALISATSICGYKDGDPLSSRTANPGYRCRYDGKAQVWGFCAENVDAISDCRLNSACFDLNSFTSGCGWLNDPSGHTVRCTKSTKGFCSAAFLTANIDQTYTYLDCADSATVDHLQVTPTDSPDTITSMFSSTITAASASFTTSLPTATSASHITTPALVASTNTPAAAGGTITGNSHAPAIVGGVLGGLAIACCSLLVLLLLRRRRTHPVYHDLKPKISGPYAAAKETDVKYYISDIKSSLTGNRATLRVNRSPVEISESNYWPRSPAELAG